MSIPSEENIKEKRGSWIKKALFAIGFLTIFYNFAFFVGKNTVDIPFWDQWGLVSILSNKLNLWNLFIYQHNEHRIGIGLIIISLLSRLSHWSQILEIKFISSLIISSSLIILYLKYSISKKIEILDLIIPLVFLNIFQFENINWGFQISFVLPLFFFCVWLAAIRIENTTKRNIALSTLSLLSAYSIFHGLILPFLTIGYITYVFFKTKSEKLRHLLFFVFLNIFIIGSYFINYKKNFQTSLLSNFSSKTVEYFSLAVGNGFFYSLQHPIINYLLLAITFVVLANALYELVIKNNRNMNFIIGSASIIFALLFVSIITIGRSSFGASQALSSRYVTFTLLIPIGMFFIFSQYKKGIYLKLALLFFLVYNVIFLSSPIRSYAKMMTTGKQKALDCYLNNSEKYSDCFAVFNLYPDQKYLDSEIPDAFRLKSISADFRPTISKDYFNTFLDGKFFPISESEIMKKAQNIEKRGDIYSALNSDPNFSISTPSAKGLSWKSTAQGNTRLYYLFKGEKDYSEEYADDIKGVGTVFSLNIELLEKKFSKKLISLRIDPTDKIEEFKMNDFKEYR